MSEESPPQKVSLGVFVEVLVLTKIPTTYGTEREVSFFSPEKSTTVTFTGHTRCTKSFFTGHREPWSVLNGI